MSETVRAYPAAPGRAWRYAAWAGYVLPAAGSLWHILARTAPPFSDESHYLTGSVLLWQDLASGRLFQFMRDYVHVYAEAGSHVTKAPLSALLPFPFYALFGPGVAQAVLANLAVLGAASWFAWRIGRLLHSPQAGALAVWCLNLTPIVYGLSRLMLVECSQAALAIAFVYYLLLGASMAPLGLCLGLGLLCKVSFPLYVVIPALLFGGRRRSGRDWVVIVAIGTAVAATWYAWNFFSILDYAWGVSFGQDALQAIARRGHISLARFTEIVVVQCWGTAFVVGAAASVGAILAAGPRSVQARHWRIAAAFLGWGAFPLAVVALSYNRETRFTAAALAGASVGLGVLLAAAARRLGRWGSAATVLLLAWPAAVYWEQTTGRGLPRSMRAGQEVRAWAWNGPPKKNCDWGQEELLAVIAREAGKSRGTRLVVFSFANKYFNHRLGNYYAALRRWPLRFQIHVSPADPERVLRLITASGADFVVSAAGFPGDALPRRQVSSNAVVCARLGSGPWPYRIWRRLPLGNGAAALVFRRVIPSAEALSLRRKTTTTAPLSSRRLSQSR